MQMRKEQSGADIARSMLKRLARSRPNDGVKLAFLSPQQLDTIDTLDLTLLEEFRRSDKGGAEVRFVDRLRLAEKALELSEDPDGQATAFFQALENRGSTQNAV